MNMKIKSAGRAIAAIAVASMALSTGTTAQESTDDVAKFRFGIFGGGGYNYVSAPLQRYVGITSDPSFTSRDYSGGAEFAPYGGVTTEYLFHRLLGVGLRASYDDRTVSAEVGSSTFTPRISYISIEPSLRVNLLSGLYFNMGPSVSFPIIKKYDYTPVNAEGGGTIEDAELREVNEVAFGAWGGFGYDIALNSRSTGLRWYLTPFVEGSWLYDQKKPDVAQSDLDEKWTSLSARAGVQIKLGPAPDMTKPVTDIPPPAHMLNATVRAPRGGVLQNGDLVEHMPVVNYLFFDRDSTGIPMRYHRLRPDEVASFDETRAVAPISTGSTMSAPPSEARQMQVYYNMLNVFGKRMMKHPESTITLVGSTPDQKTGLAMAEEVKRYLVSTFGIGADRIAVRGQIRPPHASGTRVTPKEELPLVAEENRRVEILTDSRSLLEPVKLHTEMHGPAINDLDISVSAPAPMTRWNVTITGKDFARTYGPFRTATHRIDARAILGVKERAAYTAKIVATLENGETLTKEVPFELRSAKRPNMSGNRYSILFEYDESKTVELYEGFLRRTVAPALPEGSYVLIHGHTDMIGDEAYNAELSLRRAETTMEILSDELEKLGRNVMLDYYGYGEYPDATIFTNESPEGRHYNRTVIVDILEEM